MNTKLLVAGGSVLLAVLAIGLAPSRRPANPSRPGPRIGETTVRALPDAPRPAMPCEDAAAAPSLEPSPEVGCGSSPAEEAGPLSADGALRAGQVVARMEARFAHGDDVSAEALEGLLDELEQAVRRDPKALEWTIGRLVGGARSPGAPWLAIVLGRIRDERVK